MKQPINEIKRMQQLAGVLTENEENYTPNMDHIKPYEGLIIEIKDSLVLLNNEIEQDGPLSEDIVDAVEALDNLLEKLQQDPVDMYQGNMGDESSAPI
jgi:hypothetical protein